jgi:pimeloyl-ACP methyl ester carboxylesterase
MVMGCSRRVIVDFQHEIARTDFRDELNALTVPVTVIQGTADVSAPENLCGRRIVSLLPSAELVLYEGVGHGPMVTHALRLADDIARRAKMEASSPGSPG